MRKMDFDGLVDGLNEAVAFAKGGDVPGIRIHIPADIDIKAIRGTLGLTQVEFAGRYGFTEARVRDWEQGRRVPDSGIRAYLKVIAKEPKTVERVLEMA